MEKKWGIFVVHFFNFLDSFGLEKFLDCGWTWTEFKKIRTGSGSQNMVVRSSLARRSLLGITKNQFSLYIHFRAALSLRGTVGESSRHCTVPRHGVWKSLFQRV